MNGYDDDTKPVRKRTKEYMIALIDRYYNPRGIGINNDGNGLSAVQDLKNLDKFRGQVFETKVQQ